MRDDGADDDCHDPRLGLPLVNARSRTFVHLLSLVALIFGLLVMAVTAGVVLNTNETDTFASIQARASLVGLAFTGVLVSVTMIYVSATLRLADEAGRTNDLAARNFERMLLVSAPVLILTVSPDATTDRDGQRVVVSFRLANVGEGVATEIEVVSDWELPMFEAAIARDLPINLAAAVTPPDNGGPRPIFTAFRFTDAGGTRYEQPVGGRPRVLDA